jgi:hypothetical protein
MSQKSEIFEQKENEQLKHAVKKDFSLELEVALGL